MFEAVFRSIVELEGFIEKLDQKFKIEEKETYYIVEDIKKEEFMAEPDLLSLVTDVK